MKASTSIFSFTFKTPYLDGFSTSNDSNYFSPKQTFSGSLDEFRFFHSLRSNKDLKRIASGYGTRIDPFLKVRRMHYGQDFSIKKGTPIYATADGRVSIVKSSFGGLGKYIYLDHGNGYKTVYGHLDKFNVRRGQKVKRGELIAYSGNSGRSTAPHLHYEVHKNGKKLNPINFFFNDLTPNEYEEVIKLASVENQALGSTF